MQLARISLLLIALVLQVSCGRHQEPERLVPPKIDAAAAGREAVQQYDQNGDGAIAGEELDAAPALRAAFMNLDRNQDGRATADEITARIEQWQARRIAISTLGCRVLLDGQPLEGAAIRLEPAPFLGPHVKPAAGVTDANGVARPTIAEADRPAPDIIGVHCGFYRIRISKMQNGQELLPDRYHSDTILGAEINAEAMENGLRFDLTSQ